jgi:hypothetical protein
MGEVISIEQNEVVPTGIADHESSTVLDLWIMILRFVLPC